MGALAQVVDVLVGVVCTVSGAKHQVNDQANNQTCDNLDAQNRKEALRGLLVSDKDRDHLVRRGKDHGNQRARCHDAAGKQGRRHSREAALRQGTQHRAHNRAGLTRALDRRLDLAAGKVLKGLHGQVGHKQERDELQRVKCAVGQYIAQKFQK